MTKRFVLARHGETDWNREGRIQGWARVPLNETGRRQAHRLADFLAAEYPEIGHIEASDLPRAAETARIVADAEPFRSLSIDYCPEWRERDFGVYQGHRSETFFQEHPEFAILSRGYAAAVAVPEKGESYVEFRRRVRDRWGDFVREVEADTVLLVCHSGVIRAILSAIHGLDPGEAIEGIELDNASASVVTYDCGTGTAEVTEENVRPAPDVTVPE